MDIAKKHKFQNKVIVIIGAGGVLCAYFAKELAKTKVKIALLGINLATAAQWLAVYFSLVGIRCNAIAFGFLVSNQNRALLCDAQGNPTASANRILANTPMGRFGESHELQRIPTVGRNGTRTAGYKRYWAF